MRGVCYNIKSVSAKIVDTQLRRDDKRQSNV